MSGRSDSTDRNNGCNMNSMVGGGGWITKLTRGRPNKVFDRVGVARIRAGIDAPRLHVANHLWIPEMDLWQTAATSGIRYSHSLDSRRTHVRHHTRSQPQHTHLTPHNSCSWSTQRRVNHSTHKNTTHTLPCRSCTRTFGKHRTLQS
jgi:hypothetical protein